MARNKKKANRGASSSPAPTATKVASSSAASKPAPRQAGSSPTTAQSSPPDDRSVPRHQTWRIRGVPSGFDQAKLADILEHHRDLQTAEEATANEADSGISNNVKVHTLALDSHDQTATVRFRRCPARLTTLERGHQLTINIPTSSDDTSAVGERGRDSSRTVSLTIDQDFDSVTVLSAPSSGGHDVDVLAVSGLGSHAFGSFIHKESGYIWLSDSLSRDMLMARVMIYGYESGL